MDFYYQIHADPFIICIFPLNKIIVPNILFYSLFIAINENVFGEVFIIITQALILKRVDEKLFSCLLEPTLFTSNNVIHDNGFCMRKGSSPNLKFMINDIH